MCLVNVVHGVDVDDVGDVNANADDDDHLDDEDCDIHHDDDFGDDENDGYRIPSWTSRASKLAASGDHF